MFFSKSPGVCLPLSTENQRSPAAQPRLANSRLFARDLETVALHQWSRLMGFISCDRENPAEAITRAAIELGPFGITVNAIAPGPIQTGYLTEADEAHLSPVNPVGRIGHPGDIVHAAIFLASCDASFITGQIVTVDGNAL